jgi:hypothetical protein
VARFVQFSDTKAMVAFFASDTARSFDMMMMTPQFLATATFAMLGSLTVAAQTPTPSSSRPQPPSAPMTGQADQKADQKSVTLTGCLKAWDASMDASRGSAGAARETGATTAKFMLSNANDDTTGGNGSATMTTGSKASAAATQYTLTAGTGVDLSAHVNHQVRVTGMRQDAAATSVAPSGPMANQTRSGDAQKMTGDKAVQTLTVSSVTMISSTCTK